MKHWHGNYRTGLPVERIVDRISADWQQVLVSRDQSCDLMLMAPPTPLCIQTHFQDTRLMQCSRIRIVYVFSELKKHDFLRFFWNDVSKSRKKSQKVWSLPNVYRKFGIKTARCYGYGLLYRRLSHTFFSVAYVVSCVHTCEQDVWCWWPWFTGTDLQQLSAKWLSGLWNYTYVFYFFYVFTFFFKIQKKHDFVRALSCCPRFLKHWTHALTPMAHVPESGGINQLHAPFSSASFWYVCHAYLAVAPESSGTRSRW